MTPTDQDLAVQLKITRQDIRRRKELLGFTEEDAKTLAELKPSIDRSVSSLVDEFYADQVTKPEIERTIGDSGTLGRLKHHMSNYILDMFSGVYDDVYVLSRLRIGLVHDRIGVAPRLYISSIRTLFQIIRKRLPSVLSTTKQCNNYPNTLRVIEKIILFDLTLVMDTYIHSLVKQITISQVELERYTKSLEEEISSRTKELIEFAQTDPLTKLSNRRAFFDVLRREIARSIRHKEEFVLAYIDLDNFKQVNDTLGHQEGDRILICVAEAMRESFREEDLGARIGGDEFAVIISNADLAKAQKAIDRLAKQFDAAKGNSIVTMSVGLARFNLEYPQLPDALMKEADIAMYKVKKHKRSSVAPSLDQP